MTAPDLHLEPDEQKAARLRELVPAAGAGIYLDAANRGPLSAEAAAAMREAEEWEVRIGRAWEGRDEDVLQRQEEARAVLAALLVADPGSVAIAPGPEAAAMLVRDVLGVGRQEIVRDVDPATGERRSLAAGGRRPLVVDLSLSAGALPVSIEDLELDGAIFAVDRWLMGPEGVSGVWLRQAPAGVGMVLARTQLVGLARTIGWLEMYVGLDWAYQRTARLTQLLHGTLSSIARVAVATPADSLAAIVSFRVEHWPVDATVDELRRRVFAIIAPAPGGRDVRASVGWWNTDEEIARFCGAVAEIAANTPESIPRRLPLLGQ
jgi:selenocysteine lyase/cysteine desulfurase